jgi:hypothetical protein
MTEALTPLRVASPHQEGLHMIVGDIGLGELIWGLVVLMFILAYLMMLFSVIVDVFRDHDLSGGAKALWLICLLFFPVVSLVAYVVARGPNMAARQLSAASASAAQLDSLAQTMAGPTSPAQEIANAKSLLDAGTISVEEFEALKARALG